RLRERVTSTAEFAVQAAAIRVIARGRPAGAAEVLLAYAPFVADATVLDEIGKALGVLAVRDGQVDPAVTQALTAKAGIARGLAGEGLARANRDLSAVRKLLQDEDPS